MSFIGTQQKCKACTKTVYPVEEISVDGISYHKSCFKCNHCQGKIQLSAYASMEGVLYCKPHFQQLFKETGSYEKSFQSASGAGERPKPERRKSLNRVASMFSGTQDKCTTCGKTAYPLEKVTVESRTYHKTCFKCSHGACSITPSSYAALDGVLYCKPHFSQLFKEKGSYKHLTKCASMKNATVQTVTVPEA